MPTKAMTTRQRQLAAGLIAPDPRVSACRRGYDRNWAKLRAEFIRANPVCVFCRHPAAVVDHVRPLTAGGARLDPGNLRSVCRKCHDLITSNYKQTGRNEMPTKEQVQ